METIVQKATDAAEQHEQEIVAHVVHQAVATVQVQELSTQIEQEREDKQSILTRLSEGRQRPQRQFKRQLLLEKLYNLQQKQLHLQERISALEAQLPGISSLPVIKFMW